MITSFYFTIVILAGSTAATAPSLIVNSELYATLSNNIIYSSEHDIVTIVTPPNGINVSDKKSRSKTKSTLDFFFVEADINDKGDKEYKGLYIFLDGKATKLLDNGVDIIAPKDKSSKAYFAAKDGIYIYNLDGNKVEKYGSVNDSIINIAYKNSTKDIYVLTADHLLYVVKDNGNRLERVTEVENAEEIVIDWEDNLFYYGADKQPYVLNDQGVRKIEGVSVAPSSVRFIRPPMLLFEEVLMFSDDNVYSLFANGLSERLRITVLDRPTALSMELFLLQYFAHGKHIYQTHFIPTDILE